MKKNLFLVAFTIGLAIFSPKNASADLGPKPSTNIEVFYNGQSMSSLVFNVRILSCVSEAEAQRELEAWKTIGNTFIPQLQIETFDSSKNCYWHPEIGVWGDQYGQCKNSICHFGPMEAEYDTGSYSVSLKEFKFAVFVPSLNKTFITNSVSNRDFNSTYRAELFSDGSAKITNTTAIFSSDKTHSFLLAFFITIILELLVSLIFVSIKKLPKRILANVLLVNMITLPIVWFLFPLLGFSGVVVIILSEIFAFLFEAYFIYFLGKQFISFKQSAALSILNNSVSLFIGGFIYIFIALIFNIHT